jgi:hypothetical protein
MSIPQLKKTLAQLDKAQLVDLLLDMYRKHKPVKEYLDFYVSPDERALFEKYSDKVVQAFFPKRGFGFSLKDGKKAIADFKKLGGSNEMQAELLLIYVENGVRFTLEYGDIDEPFYVSIENTYAKALSMMKTEGILGKFATRAAKIVQDSRNTGWGFYEALSHFYTEHYPQAR